MIKGEQQGDIQMRKRKRGNSEGSIYKMQDGRWRAAVTTGKDVGGKPKRKVFTRNHAS